MVNANPLNAGHFFARQVFFNPDTSKGAVFSSTGFNQVHNFLRRNLNDFAEGFRCFFEVSCLLRVDGCFASGQIIN